VRGGAGGRCDTWGADDRFSLVLRLHEADTSASIDGLLAQWPDHLA